MKKMMIGLLCFVCVLLGGSQWVQGAGSESDVLQKGMRGDNIVGLQQQLTRIGYYYGDMDGIFGDITLGAVQAFQRDHGIEPTGKVNGELLQLIKSHEDERPKNYSQSLVMSATGYSASDPGNAAYTYGGHQVRKGLVAVDPGVIPLGTHLYIEGYGYAVADDIGGGIHGNKIDLAFDSHGDALRFGRQRVTVYILQ